jgi:hypothetical protein
VHRAVARDGGVLVEVLRDRYADEEGETQDELGPEAVQVAELKEAQTTRTCSAKERTNETHTFILVSKLAT